MLSRVLAFISLVITTAAFSGSLRPSFKLSSSLKMSTAADNKSFLPKVVTSGIVSLSLLYGQYQPINSDSTTKESSTSFSLIQPAHADFRAQQKRTYFRFIPKLETGLKFYASDLKKAIDEEKFDVVKTFFEEFVVKVNPNDPNQIDAKDTYVNEKFYRPMVVFSGTFAERGTSLKQRQLLEQKDAFATAMGDLEGCVKDRREGGLFGKEIKMPTGKARKTQALEAWERGKVALNEYIKIADQGLMLELNPIKTI